MTTYDVTRQHFGDKQYWPGDTREADRADVQHLIDNGVLVESKAAPKVENKAAQPVKNKAGA